MNEYGLDPKQLLRYVIRPTLQHELQLWSPSAEILVLGTALVESKLKWLDQLDKANLPGPAFGLWQCERATHDDLYVNFLAFHPQLLSRLTRLASHSAFVRPRVEEVVRNLGYACAVCRLDYYREKAALPAAHDAARFAAYHKRFYNSSKGATDVSESVVHFQNAIEISEAA